MDIEWYEHLRDLIMLWKMDVVFIVEVVGTLFTALDNSLQVLLPISWILYLSAENWLGGLDYVLCLTCCPSKLGLL
jgi:hypothetical protein